MEKKIELNRLSNSEVISRLECLVLSEKETATEIIRHLAEVDRRRLYASEGFSSLFEYVTKKLGYSKTSAMRRISVARAAKKLPEVFSYLEEDKVTLSSLNACGDLLLGEHGKQVLEELQGKSKEEAEWLTASYQPVKKVRDTVEKICIGEVLSSQKDLFIPDENSNKFRGGTKLEERFKLSFSASPEFMEKLTRVQELMFSGKAEDIALEKIFGEALDLFIDKYCPKERLKRREVRQTKKPVEQKHSPEKRFIPVWLRDEVLKRDDHCCNYTTPEGRP